MKNYRKELLQQQSELMALIKQNNKNIKALERVELKPVEVLCRNGSYSYYYSKNGKRKCVGKKEYERIRKILQKNYEIKMQKKLTKLNKALELFLKSYDVNDIYEVYDNRSAGRRKMIKPLIKCESDFIKEWLSEHPGEQNLYYDRGAFKTMRGEYVRSKSEKIIADMLYQRDIPYQYEPLLELGLKTVYPDFAILDLNTRETVYWEHLGLVSDDEYAKKNFMKIAEYEENGYVLGKDLIITQEAEGMPLNIKIVEMKMNRFIRC